jgi:hypothetical protein
LPCWFPRLTKMLHSHTKVVCSNRRHICDTCTNVGIWGQLLSRAGTITII